MSINGLALGALAVGAVFVYGGINGKSPLMALQSVIQGQTPSGDPQTTPLTPAGDTADPGPPTTPNPPTTHGDTSPNANRALGKMLAAERGWGTGAQWTALDNLFTRESGWSNIATGKLTPQGRAYGIAQALPPTKYPPLGQASGGSDPGTQITWGLNYIAQRYGTPVQAWAHETSQGWY